MSPEEFDGPDDPDRAKLGAAGKLADARRSFAETLPHEKLLALYVKQQEEVIGASAKSAAGASKNAGRKRARPRSEVRVLFNKLGARLRRSLPRRGYEATDTNIARAMLQELVENFEHGRSELLPDGFIRAIPELDRKLYTDPCFRLGDEAGASVKLCSPHDTFSTNSLIRYTLEK